MRTVGGYPPAMLSRSPPPTRPPVYRTLSADTRTGCARRADVGYTSASRGRRDSRLGRVALTMPKDGIRLDIPGFGRLHLKAMCSDYTGTLSYRGKLIRGVRTRLFEISEKLDIHVVTSDTRKTARAELQGIPLTLQDDIPSSRHDDYKKDYVENIGIDLNQVVVFGNGQNDRLWLRAVRDAGGLAIAVDVGEGCAMETMTTAHVFVSGITKALDLLVDDKRLIGTLRTR
jgi:soluble P-type ATPase